MPSYKSSSVLLLNSSIALEPNPNSDYNNSCIALVGLVRLGPSRTIFGTGCSEEASSITLLSQHMRGRLDPVANMGSASHKLVLPSSANNTKECFEDDCSPYLRDIEVGEMQRRGSPAWENSCAARQRKLELQHKANEYENIQ